jgi:MoaA/NifB/PqqE/SkfB family radical SAM enzyme
MNTNGMLIKKQIDAVKNIDSLCVSIDGNEETNDQARGKGVYAKLIENIEVALNNKLNMRLHCCLTQNTKTTLLDIIGLAEKYNINFNFADYNYRVDTGPDLKEVLTKEQSDEFYREYRRHKKVCPHISSSLQTIDYKLNWPYKDKIIARENDFKDKSEKPYYRCQIKNRHFFIDADGGVYACGARWKDGLNYKEVGFQKAWEYLGSMDCVACDFINCFEQSAVLDLQPSVILNAIRGYLV